MNRPVSTHRWPARTIGLLLLAGLLLVGLPVAAQAIKVTSAVPDTTEQGVVGLVVTVGGENFASGARVSFYVTGTKNPGGIAVKSVKFKDARTLEATIDVAPDAQTDLKFDVEVKCNGRTGKGTELFKVLVKTTGGDTTPPGTVADLQAPESGLGFNTAVLTWTAPADDGFDAASGPAAEYDIRVRKADCGPYTMEIWVDDTMTGITNDPCHVYWWRPAPHAPGTAETITALFLAPDTEYWAVVRTTDDSAQGPNWSPLPGPPGQLLFRTAAFPPDGWSAPWSTQVVDACPVVGWPCRMYAPARLDLDSSGKLSMLYVKGGIPILASWTGSSWTFETLTLALDTGNYNYDFAIDPATSEATIASLVPNPTSATKGQLRFYRRTATGWLAETIATGDLPGWALAYDPVDQLPTVAYLYSKSGSSQLRVAQKRDGSWRSETVASGALSRGVLAFDAGGNPAVCVSLDVNGTARPALAYRQGGSWHVELAGTPEAPWTSPVQSAVAFDPLRHDFSAATLYRSDALGTNQILFCERTSGSWSCEMVGPRETNMGGLSLAIGADGTAYLSYKANMSLFMAVRRPSASGWTAEYVDWNIWGGPRVDLHVGPDGRPAIAYGSANDSTHAGGSDSNYAVSFARRTVTTP